MRYVLSPNRPAVVTVTTPNGEGEEFDLTPSPGSQSIQKLQQTTAAYTPRPGTLGHLRPLGDTRLWIPDGQPGNVTLYYDGTVDPYDPTEFEYTAPTENPAASAISSTDAAPYPLRAKISAAESSSRSRVRARVSARVSRRGLSSEVTFR